VITYSKDDIDFSRARPVISVAQKFVIPVAAFEDADPLVYPSGTEHAGEPITGWQGNPVGEKGIVFFNEIDKAYQAAPADGCSVIIINEVTSEQAHDLQELVHELGEPDNLSKSSLERVLAHARNDLRLVDIYNSTDKYVRAKMTPVGEGCAGNGRRPWGWHRRDGGYVSQAAFVGGPARFQGPAATPQQIPDEGGFIVRQDWEGKQNYHMVEARAMQRTYLNADGTPIDLRNFADAAKPSASSEEAPAGAWWRHAPGVISRLLRSH
jgi:hypothetical protein